MRLSILLLAGAIQLFALPAMADGALAIDERQGDKWGWAIDYPDILQARARALDECGEGCTIVDEFADGCGAYAADAIDGSTVWSWARADSGASARYTALNECIKRGGAQCMIRVWGCNSAPMTEAPQVIVEGVPSADAVPDAAVEDAPSTEGAGAGAGADGRMVFVQIEAYRELPDDRNSYTLYCGWTHASSEELSQYKSAGHQPGLIKDSDRYASNGEVQPGLQPVGRTGVEGHRLDQSPIARRFVEAVMAHPEYEPPTGSKYWPDGPYQVSKGVETILGWIYETDKSWSLEDLNSYHCDYHVERMNTGPFKEVPVRAIVVGQF